MDLAKGHVTVQAAMDLLLRERWQSEHLIRVQEAVETVLRFH